MATISGFKTSASNTTSSTPGLLTNELTAVMQKEKIIPNELMVVGRKGVFTLKMLYDWWMIYASRKNLIKEKKWIVPNETIDALLADSYIKFGANINEPYHVQTYLRMLGSQLSYIPSVELNAAQLNYLKNQELLLNNFRKNIV